MKKAKARIEMPLREAMKCLGISYHISIGGIEKTVQATAYSLS